MRLRYFSIVLGLVCALGLSSVYGQTESGSVYVGGSGMLDISSEKQWGEVSYDGDSQKSDEERVYTLNLNSELGFRVIEGLYLGFIVDRTGYRSRDDNDMVFKQNTFSLGPMVRYYIPTGKIKPYVGGALYVGYMNRQINKWVFAEDSKSYDDENYYNDGTDYSFTNSNMYDDENTTLYWVTGFGVGSGIAVFLTDNFSLDFGVRYMGEKVRFKEEDVVFEEFRRRTSFQIGMYYFF